MAEGKIMTEEEHQDLIDLSWRYAVLIGVTDHEGIVTEEIAQADRKRWPDLIKTHDGLPVFDENGAVSLMMELSGMSDEDCRKVLLEEWEC